MKWIVAGSINVSFTQPVSMGVRCRTEALSSCITLHACNKGLMG